jgi:hypothetical protein
MNPIQPIARTARNGVKRTVNMDVATYARAAYCSRVVANHLGSTASFSTIIRRAIVVYQSHCEALVKGSLGKPSEAEMYRQIELRQLDIVNEGAYHNGITAEEVNESPTLKTLGELQRAKVAAQPTIAQQIAAGVGEWK